MKGSYGGDQAEVLHEYLFDLAPFRITWLGQGTKGSYTHMLPLIPEMELGT